MPAGLIRAAGGAAALLGLDKLTNYAGEETLKDLQALSNYGPRDPAFSGALGEAERGNLQGMYPGGILDSIGKQTAPVNMEAELLKLATQGYVPNFPTSSAGAGRGGPASTGINLALADTGAGAGRGFVNPAAGTNTPVIDPSENFLNNAFPEIFRKTPPQGIVNTQFGVERVNARTSEHGTTATKDAQGRVTLSNVGPDGRGIQGTGSPNSVLGNGMGKGKGGMNQPLTGNQQLLMPNVSMSLQAAMNSLTDPSTTVDAAIGHFANIQQEIALQQTKMQGEAIKFAEAQFGIPDLNAQLQQSLIADKNSPSWYPGIGDSPVTTRIRQAIQSASNDVQITASNYLKANTSFTSLSVTSKSAEMAFKNNEIRNNRKEALTDRADLNKANKEEAALQKRVQLGASLPMSAQARLMVIDPTLANTSGDDQLARVGDIVARSSRDKAMETYLSVPENELPIIAISGNNYAKTALMAAEVKAGRTATSVQADMDYVASLVTKKDFHQLAVASKYRNTPDDKAMKAELATLQNAKAIGGDATTKAMNRNVDIKLAMDMKRQEVAAAPVADIRHLVGAETILGDAIKISLAKGNNASIKNVLTAYIGDASGPTRIQKVQEFKSIMDGIGSSQPVSVFGAPSGALIAQAIVEASMPDTLHSVGVPAMGAIQLMMQAPQILRGQFSN